MEAIDRPFLSNDLITITFFVGLLLVFFMKLYKPKHLLGYTIAFFTQGFIEKETEDNISIFSIFHGLLFFFTVITVTASLFILFSPLYFEKNLDSLLHLLLGTLIYFILKRSIDHSLMSLFNLKEKTNYLSYTKNGYLNTVCLLLFPFLILNQYFIKSNLILLLFILYFCTLELSPLVILYKTIN